MKAMTAAVWQISITGWGMYIVLWTGRGSTGIIRPEPGQGRIHPQGRIHYKNKVLFTHVEYPEFQSAYYIKGFEEQSELGTITNFKNHFWRRRYLDDFDYVKFFNRTNEERG